MIPEHISISVYEVVGNGFCVSSDDGQKIHDQIVASFQAGEKVRLSFKNVGSLTAIFLNAAVGQLYSEFSEVKIKSNLEVVDMELEDLVLLKRVVDNAKEYFKNLV